MAAQITIPVSNVASLISVGFTRIEVHHSTDDGNSYQEVTAPAADSAFLDSALPQTLFRMGGKVLKFQVDGGLEKVVSFSALVDFWSASQVAGRINEVAVGVASVVAGVVRLSSATTGRSSSISITYNDAADLGWVVGDGSRGHDVRLTLMGGTFVYSYLDIAGSTSDRYKWRFSANGAVPISGFSERVFGSPPAVAAPTAIATATFAGLDGKPLKRRIIIVAGSFPQNISGVVVGDESPQVAESDSDGFLQVPLVRGAVVRVAIEGTAFVREFTVPNVATFDLMTVMSSSPDPFTVQVPAPLLNRRAL